MTDKHTVVPVADVAPTRGLMHPLVERMLTTNPTPEALEKILGLQREWEKDEARRAYDAALVSLKKALPPFLLRDKTVDFTSAKGRTHYTHTSLAGAMETVTPMLSDHGFSLTWKPGNNAKGLVTVTAKLTHRQGYFEESMLEAGPDTTGNKSGPQAVASTVTLLARYACLGLLGLATADMTEPNGETQDSPERVDTARNMKAIASIVKAGKTKADAERVAGKPMAEWTGAELDKLRAWMDPPKQPQSFESAITPDEVKVLKALMAEFEMTPERFGAIIENEIGRKPNGAADIRKSEYAQICAAFGGVRIGAMDLKGNVIERPPG